MCLSATNNSRKPARWVLWRRCAQMVTRLCDVGFLGWTHAQTLKGHLDCHEGEVTKVAWIVADCEATKVHWTAAWASLDLPYFPPEGNLMSSLCHLIIWHWQVRVWQN